MNAARCTCECMLFARRTKVHAPSHLADIEPTSTASLMLIGLMDSSTDYEPTSVLVCGQWTHKSNKMTPTTKLSTSKAEINHAHCLRVAGRPIGRNDATGSCATQYAMQYFQGSNLLRIDFSFRRARSKERSHISQECIRVHKTEGLRHDRKRETSLSVAKSGEA